MLESIRELLDRDPFIPFRIVLSSGKEYEIIDPHLVALGQTLINVFAPKSDKWSELRLSQISSIDVGQAA
jgi:hypothetical protein